MQSMKDVMKAVHQRLPQKGNPQEILKQLINYPPIQHFIDSHQDQLSQEMILNSLSKLNEFRLEKEALDQGQEGQNPGFTPELVIHYNYIDVTYVPTPAYLAKAAEQRTAALVDNRMMSRDVQEAQLVDYQVDNLQRQALMEAVTAFLVQVKEDLRQARGLFITGPFGVGKTYLLGALANALAHLGIQVTMLHYPTFTNEMKALIGQDNQLFMTLNQIKRVPVLILDDMGAESNSAWLRDDILGIILEHRMKESLPTFFTSNFTMMELESHLAASRDASDVTKAARIMERIRYLAQEYPLAGANRRLSDR